MKRIVFVALLTACALLLGGCSSVESTLREVGARLERDSIATPQNNGGDIDWSFVPIVRDLATDTFTESFPEASVTNTNVASVNGRSDRVIVVVSYAFKDGRSGEYGFDYQKNAQGEYELRRYGEGVDVGDLH